MRPDSLALRPILVEFDPQPDITAFELAKCLTHLPSNMRHISFMPQEWRGMDPGVKRHFRTV